VETGATRGLNQTTLRGGTTSSDASAGGEGNYYFRRGEMGRKENWANGGPFWTRDQRNTLYVIGGEEESWGDLVRNLGS